jgi:hypothetical protein
MQQPLIKGACVEIVTAVSNHNIQEGPQLSTLWLSLVHPVVLITPLRLAPALLLPFAVSGRGLRAACGCRHSQQGQDPGAQSPAAAGQGMKRASTAEAPKAKKAQGPLRNSIRSIARPRSRQLSGSYQGSYKNLNYY